MSFPLLRAAYSQKKINCSSNIPPWYGSVRKLAEILNFFFLTNYKLSRQNVKKKIVLAYNVNEWNLVRL